MCGCFVSFKEYSQVYDHHPVLGQPSRVAGRENQMTDGGVHGLPEVSELADGDSEARFVLPVLPLHPFPGHSPLVCISQGDAMGRPFY
jgi:hypothetical protein